MTKWACVLLGIFTCVSLAQQRPNKPAIPGDKEGDELQQQREEYFYGRRAYPLNAIPAGARLNAVRQMERMRVDVRAHRSDLGLSNTQWTSIGPRAVNSQGFLYASGRVSAVAVDPRSADTVYIGGADGGVWKSLDGGKNWTALTDNQATLAIGSLALDPTNPDIVYVGTGDPNGYLGAGILKSTDAGNTWTNIPGPFVGSRVGGIAVHPTNGQIVIAAKTSAPASATDGIYRSADGGATWTLVQPGAGFSVYMDATTAYAALVYNSTNGGIYRSKDNGQTWTAINGSGSTALPIANSVATRMAVAPSSPTTLYVSLSDTSHHLLGLYKSVDGGGTWNAFNNLPPDYCQPQCQYSNVLAVHPTNPNALYAGGIGAIRTLDGGLTWTDIFGDDFGNTSDIVHVDQQSIGFAADGQRMYLGDDGGIYSTPDFTSNGVVYTDLNATLTLTQFYPGISIHPSDTTISFGGTQDNSTERSGAGLTWDTVACGDGGQTAIDFNTPTTVYAACTQIHVNKSTDGGNTFTPVDSTIPPGPVAFIAPLVMDPSNPARLYFGTNVVNQTTNGAGVWAPISPAIDSGSVVSAIGVSASDPNTVYAGTQSGKLQVSRNALAGAGATWADHTAGLPNRVITQIAVDPGNPLIAYVTFSGFNASTIIAGHVFRTPDGGVTWKDISSNLPDVPADDVVVDPDIANTLYLGTDLGAFITSNGGTSWAVMATGLPKVAVNSLRLHRQARILRAATFGRGMWDIAVPSPNQSSLPVLTSLSPAISAAGSAAFTLTINGSGFASSSTVQWNGQNRTTTVVNSGQLTASISTSDIAVSGTSLVSVSTPLPGGGLSNGLPFVAGATLPAPSLTGVSPATMAAGGAGLTLTATGTNFVAGSTLQWNGSNRPTTVLSTTKLSAAITAADVASAGTGSITVTNPTPGGGKTSALSFFITGVTQGSQAAGSVWAFNGTAASPLAAPLGTITSLTNDSAGNLYIMDSTNCLVFKLTPAGVMTAVGGTGYCFGGENAFYRFAQPVGVAVDPTGKLYVSDTAAFRVVLVNPNQTLTLFAGQGEQITDGDGGPAVKAGFGSLGGIAFDAAGNMYIADTRGNRIRKVDKTGTITTFAGSAQQGFGGDGGPATSAKLSQPYGVAVDASGNVYIADTFNRAIRKVNAAGIISTIAGNPNGGFTPIGDGGPATSAVFNFPKGVAVDAAGNVYIADTTNNRIRKVNTSGIISTIAGTGTQGFSGDGGAATSAALSLPQAVSVDSSGNVYVADSGNLRVRKINPGGVIATVAGNGQFKFSGDGGPAISANFNGPQGLSVDGLGNLYVADTGNNRIRKITPAGVVSTVAGAGSIGLSGDGGPATAAQLNAPVAVAADAAGNLYIADTSNNVIRKVSPSGVISTFAGGGQRIDDGAPATSLFVNLPGGVAVDSSGNMFIAGRCNVWKVNTAGTVANYAGNLHQCGHSGDGGPATSALLVTATGLSVDSAGNLFITEQNYVRKVTPAGVISTVAGGGAVTNSDGSLGTSVALNLAQATAVDANGNVFITDNYSGSARVYLMSPLGNLTTIAGNGPGLPYTSVPLSLAYGVAVDVAGNLYVSDTENDRVMKVAGAVAGVPPPALVQNGIVNGASFSTAAVLSPWSIASLFGGNLAAAITHAAAVPLPTNLGGTSVLVNGAPAPLFFTSTGQINFQVPVEATGSSATVSVTAQGVAGNTVNLALAPATPGIFTTDSSGKGQAALLNQDSSPNSAANPAAALSVLQIFATGLGPTTPAVATGQGGATSAPFNSTTTTPVVLFNGVASPSVSFSAAAPGFVGLYQVNAVIPAGTPSGNVTLQVQIAGANSNVVTIAVK